MTYVRGALTTQWHDLRYYSMDSIVPAMSVGSTSGSLHLCLSLFCPASRCTVSSCTYVTSQSKVHLHQWWNRKTVSFRFSWAMAETCCPLLGIPQHSCHLASLWHCRCHQHPCLWVLSTFQDCLVLANSVKHRLVERQMADKLTMVHQWYMHWKTPIDNINDQWWMAAT